MLLKMNFEAAKNWEYLGALNAEPAFSEEQTRFSYLATKPSAELCAIYNSDNPFAIIAGKIEGSRSFKLLRRKTQINLDTAVEYGESGRPKFNRLKHTQIVTKDAVELAKVLGLNEYLTRAIALGHDCGHTPGGHKGERVLQANLPESSKGKGKFTHARQAVVNLELEGIFLSNEVSTGIANHGEDEFVNKDRKDEWIFTEVAPPLSEKRPEEPTCPEGLLVQIADNSASTLHDIVDLIQAGILKKENALENPRFEENLALLGVTVEQLFSNPKHTLAKMRVTVLNEVKNSAKDINGEFSISFGRLTQPIYVLRKLNYEFLEKDLIRQQDEFIKKSVSVVCDYYRKNTKGLDRALMSLAGKPRMRHRVALKRWVDKKTLKPMNVAEAEEERSRTRMAKFISERSFEEKMATRLTMMSDLGMNNLAQKICPDLSEERKKLCSMQRAYSEILPKKNELFVR